MIRPRSTLLIAIAVVVLSVGAVATTTSQAGSPRLGAFSAPFAEDSTFNSRPPQTLDEARRTPTAIHVAMLPDGRVLYWGDWGGYGGNGPIPLDGGRVLTPSRSRILDLRAGVPTWSTPGNTTGGPAHHEDLFCVDQRVLPDGRVLAVGGSTYDSDPLDLSPLTGDDGPGGTAEIYGTTATRWLDFRATQPAWDGSDENRMARGRWYPSLVTLPDGRVLVASGVERLIYNAPVFDQGNGANVATLETFEPATNRWTSEPESADISLPLYPRLVVAHDGKVVYDGAGMMWSPFGEAVDEALWNLHQTFDPATHRWSVTGIGAFGARSDPLSVPLMFRAPYDTTNILVAGGTLGVSPSAYLGTTASEIVTYAHGRSTSTPTGDLHNPRWFSSGVLLPNGQVLALSGGDKNANVGFGTDAAVRQAELFDPATNRWTPLASGGRDRTYHNSAILLPDGRVLVGGHAPQPDLSGENNGDSPTSDAGVTSQNLKDPSFEIFTPPYLDPELGPRPRIVSAPASMTYTSSGHRMYEMRVSGDVATVILMRLPSATHALDNDQRGIELAFQRTGATATVTPPPNANVAPPGHYYLFALTAAGVPSTARIIRLGAPPELSGVAPAPFGA